MTDQTPQVQTQSRAVAPVERLKGLLNTPAIKARFDEMLGKRSAAFTSSILSAVAANKQLAECEPMSVIQSAAIAAAMDLPINGSLGFAHIVPYKGVAQFQMGWKGFVQLAMRSGQYKTINATPVLEGQIKKHNVFTGEMEFNEAVTSDKHLGYLLYFKLLNGYEKYFYMSHAECLAHGKRYSASFKKGFGVWIEDFEAMALKTVVKMGLSKYGILSLDMQEAMEKDQAEITESGDAKYVDAVETEKTAQPTAAKSKPSKLGKIIDAQSSPVAATTPQTATAVQYTATAVDPEANDANEDDLPL
jgi:recombination protein RecT